MTAVFGTKTLHQRPLKPWQVSLEARRARLRSDSLRGDQCQPLKPRKLQPHLSPSPAQKATSDSGKLDYDEYIFFNDEPFREMSVPRFMLATFVCLQKRHASNTHPLSGTGTVACSFHIDCLTSRCKNVSNLQTS